MSLTSSARMQGVTRVETASTPPATATAQGRMAATEGQRVTHLIHSNQLTTNTLASSEAPPLPEEQQQEGVRGQPD